MRGEGFKEKTEGGLSKCAVKQWPKNREHEEEMV